MLDACVGGKRARDLFHTALQDVELVLFEDTIILGDKHLSRNASDPDVVEWCSRNDVDALITFNYRDMLRDFVVERLRDFPVNVFVGREQWSNARFPDRITRLIDFWPAIQQHANDGLQGLYQIYWHRKQVKLVARCTVIGEEHTFEEDE